ncbi:hypothetical protein [Breznakiella homolactica]|uniref:Radical SAM protein n=1 Tax=Breznakiella homolactica TaxID=2798577 RepID=A0A7T8B8P4_9SPIR|nr:hypothetical protein [Breznakiella homolactica]QQO07592.1 hypothetical protein JFL75_11610 [Breznakiella homolactica]
MTRSLRQIAAYKNGSYFVQLFDDGTKIRLAPDDFFEAAFPESIDLKITNRCTIGCPFCHENAGPSGSHADLIHIPFLETLTPGTELAIGGGAVTGHPDLVRFLETVGEKGVIANITIHEQELLRDRAGS